MSPPEDKIFEKGTDSKAQSTLGHQSKAAAWEMLAGLRDPEESPACSFCLCSSMTGHSVQQGSQKEDLTDRGITLPHSRLPKGLDPFVTHLWCDCAVTGLWQ